MQAASQRETADARAGAAGSAIYARGVTKRYSGREAVADLDLEIPPGTIFGFIGPSGAGKTTTVRVLTGIHQPDEGTVAVLGQPPAAFTAEERRASATCRSCRSSSRPCRCSAT